MREALGATCCMPAWDEIRQRFEASHGREPPRSELCSRQLLVTRSKLSSSLGTLTRSSCCRSSTRVHFRAHRLEPERPCAGPEAAGAQQAACASRAHCEDSQFAAVRIALRSRSMMPLPRPGLALQARASPRAGRLCDSPAAGAAQRPAPATTSTGRARNHPR